MFLRIFVLQKITNRPTRETVWRVLFKFNKQIMSCKSLVHFVCNNSIVEILRNYNLKRLAFLLSVVNMTFHTNHNYDLGLVQLTFFFVKT